MDEQGREWSNIHKQNIDFLAFEAVHLDLGKQLKPEKCGWLEQRKG